MVFELLREGSKDDSAKLLNSIREAQSVDDFIKSLSEAALLIPLTPQQSCKFPLQFMSYCGS